MKSLTNLYRIGRGPSSSHTIGPERAALYFKQRNPDAEGFSVTLYGSLSKTGKGHMTDAVLRQTLAPTPSEIIFDFDTDESNFIIRTQWICLLSKAERKLTKSAFIP